MTSSFGNLLAPPTRLPVDPAAARLAAGEDPTAVAAASPTSSAAWAALAERSLAWVPSEAVSARITYARALAEVAPVGSRDVQDRGFQFRLAVRPFLLFR